MTSIRRLLLTLSLAIPSLARTDLVGCTSYATVSSYHPGDTPFGVVIWYDPDTGELCDFLDCGGGRAPPKTTVPGCAAYSGTATYSPSFIDVSALTAGSGLEPVSATESGSGSGKSKIKSVFLPSVTGSIVSVPTGAFSRTGLITDGPRPTGMTKSLDTASAESGSESMSTSTATSTTMEDVTSTTVSTSTDTGGAAMVTAQAVLAAGVAACVGLL